MLAATLTHACWRSPVGDVHVLSRDAIVVALEFGDPKHRLLPMARRRFGIDMQVERSRGTPTVWRALESYFAGDFGALAGVKHDGGGTEFQRRVWAELLTIPPGQTRSYAELAQSLGKPLGARAVGLANGANPLSLLVPCHRLVGACGALTGYGGGIDVKRWLLAHEGARP